MVTIVVYLFIFYLLFERNKNEYFFVYLLIDF